MLSGLASLLLGGSQTAAVSQEPCNLKVTPADGEWELVDNEISGLYKLFIVFTVIILFVCF